MIDVLHKLTGKVVKIYLSNGTNFTGRIKEVAGSAGYVHLQTQYVDMYVRINDITVVTLNLDEHNSSDMSPYHPSRSRQRM